jgi:hypothetical protein
MNKEISIRVHQIVSRLFELRVQSEKIGSLNGSSFTSLVIGDIEIKYALRQQIYKLIYEDMKAEAAELSAELESL